MQLAEALGLAGGAGVKIGRLPNRAHIALVHMHVSIAFNSGTNDTF